MNLNLRGLTCTQKRRNASSVDVTFYRSFQVNVVLNREKGKRVIDSNANMSISPNIVGHSLRS